MKILNFIVAAICFAAALFVKHLVGSITAIFVDTGAVMPGATGFLINTGGWLPAGILVFAGIGLILIATNGSRTALLVGPGAGLVCTVVVVAVTAFLLYVPLRHLAMQTQDLAPTAEDGKSPTEPSANPGTPPSASDPKPKSE